MKKEFITTTGMAKILGISRIAVFKRIKTGKLKAFQVGRVYIIPKSEFRNAVNLKAPSIRKWQ